MLNKEHCFFLPVFWMLSLLVFMPAAHSKVVEKGSYPLSGLAVPGMEEFERRFVRLLQCNAIPGAALAIARNGKLLYARGFGWADLEASAPVQPDSLFRIASISKSLTAVAAMKLVQDGKLSLDQKAFDLLKDLKPCVYRSSSSSSGAAIALSKVDPRIYKITVRQLLDMTAGWDRTRSPDPVFGPTIAQSAECCSSTLRPDPISLIRFELTHRLDFDPGKNYAYGNFAYVVLGEVLRRASGQSYEECVRRTVLEPIGITRMQLGHTQTRVPGEVKYYGAPGEGKFQSVFPNVKEPVTQEYGSQFALEAAQGSIGWISSAIDLVRFITAVSGDRSGRSPLSEQSLYAMLTLPLPESHYLHGEFPGEFFAMGWEVDPENTAYNITLSRHGSLNGTMSYVIRRYDGISWALLFNSRPSSWLGLRSDANDMILKAIRRQKNWPAGDLFDTYK